MFYTVAEDLCSNSTYGKLLIEEGSTVLAIQIGNGTRRTGKGSKLAEAARSTVVQAEVQPE